MTATGGWASRRSAGGRPVRGGGPPGERRPRPASDEDRDVGPDPRAREAGGDVLHARADLRLGHARERRDERLDQAGDRPLPVVGGGGPAGSGARPFQETAWHAGVGPLGERHGITVSATGGADVGRPTASPHSDAQVSRPCGGRTPGRSRGRCTRSAPGRTVQRTGVDRCTDSPSMPTGTAGSSELTSTSRTWVWRSPRWWAPFSSPTACRAVPTRTAIIPSVPRSRRAR